MKKRSITLMRAISITLALVLCLALLPACGASSDDEGQVTVVISADGVTNEYVVDIGEVEITEGALSVLKYLEIKEGLEIVMTDGIYGAYLTKVGIAEADDATGAYVAIYTNVEADFDVSAYATTIEYEGISLTSSGLGISLMTVKDGGVIYICEEVYSFS